MTVLATEEQTSRDVAKKKSTPPRNDEAVRIKTEVAAKARIAAAFAGVTISEYLSEILDPILTKAINEGHARMNKASSAKPKRQQSSE
jgi:hypothetical protein